MGAHPCHRADRSLCRPACPSRTRPSPAGRAQSPTRAAPTAASLIINKTTPLRTAKPSHAEQRRRLRRHAVQCHSCGSAAAQYIHKRTRRAVGGGRRFGVVRIVERAARGCRRQTNKQTNKPCQRADELSQRAPLGAQRRSTLEYPLGSALGASLECAHTCDLSGKSPNEYPFSYVSAQPLYRRAVEGTYECSSANAVACIWLGWQYSRVVSTRWDFVVLHGTTRCTSVPGVSDRTVWDAELQCCVRLNRQRFGPRSIHAE